MEIEVNALWVEEEVGVKRIGLPIKERGLYPPEVPDILWGGLVVAVVAGPFLIATLVSLSHSHVDLQSNAELAVDKSADLVRFFTPDPTHWLIGAHPLPGSQRASTYLGYTALVLAVVGLWSGRRRASPWLWGVVVVVGFLLSLGPILQVNGQRAFLGGLEIPMPFALLQGSPFFGLISAPERFAYLTYLGIGVLAGYGLSGMRNTELGVQNRPGITYHVSRITYYLLVFVLILLEMPLRPRLTLPSTHADKTLCRAETSRC